MQPIVDISMRFLPHNTSDVLQHMPLDMLMSVNRNVLKITMDRDLKALVYDVLEGDNHKAGALSLSFPWDQEQAHNEGNFMGESLLRTLPGKDLRLSVRRKLTDHDSLYALAKRVLEPIGKSIMGNDQSSEKAQYEILANLYPSNIEATWTFLTKAKRFTSHHSENVLCQKTIKQRSFARYQLICELVRHFRKMNAGQTAEFLLKSMPGRFANDSSLKQNQMIVLGPHFDRQCFTLVCGRRRNVQTQFFVQGQWCSFDIKDDEAILFTGLQAVRYGYEPALHRVIIDESGAENSNNDKNLSLTFSVELNP